MQLSYIYDKTHAKTPYFIPELNTWYNMGAFIEIQLGHILTGEIRRPDSTKYNEGSDVPEFNLSIKSKHFTLANDLPADIEESLKTFFKNVVSKTFAYARIFDNKIIVFYMDKAEFYSFCKQFCKVESDGKTRGPRAVSKVSAWLESHL